MFNTLATNAFNARITQANLITKTDFDAKLLGLNRKITNNKSKRLLVENELNKLKTFDSIYFRGKIILMKMVRKIIIYFNHFLSI